MDLLKKALGDPSVCRMTPEGIAVNGRVVSKSETVQFKGTETKEYTVEQVLFYLANRSEKYTTYMGLCKECGIGKIYYTDQKIIVEEVENAQEASVDARIDDCSFRYAASRSYSHLRELCKTLRTGPSYIVIPSSLSSPVNLGNVVRFFESGECVSGDADGTDCTEVMLDGLQFVVREDAEDFTSEEWSRVAAIFLDGTGWQMRDWKIQDLAALFESVPTFHLVRMGQRGSVLERYRVAEVPVHNNAVDRSDLAALRERIRRHVRGGQ